MLCNNISYSLVTFDHICCRLSASIFDLWARNPIKMRNNNRFSVLIVAMGLLAVYFIDFCDTVKRACPITPNNGARQDKKFRNILGASNEPFIEHLKEHARLRIHQYFLLLMVSNMCKPYDDLAFIDIFQFAANYQDVKGSRKKGTDINTVDATDLKLPSTTVAKFGKTDAAHVCGFGLRPEKSNKKCELREELEKIISRTTEQVVEVNLYIDKVVDTKQFNFGKKVYRNAKTLVKDHFKRFVKRLKKSITKYKNTNNSSSKLDANQKSRFEFYADTYLSVIRGLTWREICNGLECLKNDYIGLYPKVKIRENVLGNCH